MNIDQNFEKLLDIALYIYLIALYSSLQDFIKLCFET